MIPVAEISQMVAGAIAILLKRLDDQHPNTQSGITNFNGLVKSAIEAGQQSALSLSEQ